MYSAQKTIERIQAAIKEKGLTQKFVLSECGINENTVKRMTDNKGISSFYLAKIADYLDCSVDYLLGRTDNPQIAGDIHISSDNGSVSNIGDNANITVSGNNDVDKTTKEFTAIFSSLDLEDRFEVMQLLMKKRKK